MKRRPLFLVLVAIAAACHFDDVFDPIPDGPINGYCAPGATYVCPCGEETWDSSWKSGIQYCNVALGFRVTKCYCDGGEDAPDAD
jgi:hypothetical protein